MPPGSSPPGPVELPGGGLSLRWPHDRCAGYGGCRQPYVFYPHHIRCNTDPFSEGALATFEADDGPEGPPGATTLTRLLGGSGGTSKGRTRYYTGPRRRERG